MSNTENSNSVIFCLLINSEEHDLAGKATIKDFIFTYICLKSEPPFTPRSLGPVHKQVG